MTWPDWAVLGGIVGATVALWISYRVDVARADRARAARLRAEMLTRAQTQMRDRIRANRLRPGRYAHTCTVEPTMPCRACMDDSPNQAA